MKAKLWGSPDGSVTLSTMMWPRFVFVYVHVTVSPYDRSIVAFRVPRDVVESPVGSMQTRFVRSQPEMASSVTV